MRHGLSLTFNRFQMMSMSFRWVPPIIMNQLCTMGPAGFLKDLESAAKTNPKVEVLELKKQLQNDPKLKKFVFKV